MSSNVDFTSQGPIIPDTDEVLADVTQYWQSAFDNLLNPDYATPQGQLITSETALIQDKNNQLLYLAQQFDPANSEGRFQDALAAIYFIYRQPARSTVVYCQCLGLEGVVIPGIDTTIEPAIVRDDRGNEFYCQKTTKIPKAGIVTVPFAAVQTGPLDVPKESVSIIATVMSGWDKVSNADAGIVGQNIESRRAFELRRQKSVERNSRSMLESVYSEVAGLDNVLDVLARQNRGDSPKIENGVTLKAHSIYVSVLGGSDVEIAKALYNSVSGGCDYNGNTSVSIIDEVTGAVETILFQRPIKVRINVTVTLRKTALTPADILSKIRKNIILDFYGELENARAGIGADLYASRFYCPVISAGASELLSVTINGKNQLTLRMDQYPSLTEKDITIIME